MNKEQNWNMKVAITGLGMFSPFGKGKEALPPHFSNATGKTKSGRFHRCPLSPQDHGVTGELSEKGWRASLLGIAASRMALGQACPFNSEIPRQMGVIIGTSLLDLSALEYYLALFRQKGPESLPPWALHYGLPLAHASHIAVSLRLQGICETFCDPLISGLHALGMGYRTIIRGETPAILAGAVDSPSGNLLFPAMAALYSKGFPHPENVELAEGSAVFHLRGENGEVASPAIRPAAYISGYAAALTAGNNHKKEVLLQQLAASAFPDGKGVDLLLDTASLSAPYSTALAAGPALACALAIALMNGSKIASRYIPLNVQFKSLLRDNKGFGRAIVFADGPAGESAAVALAAPWDRNSNQVREKEKNNKEEEAKRDVWSSSAGLRVPASKAVITGIGVASAIGLGRDVFFQALLRGAGGAQKYIPPGIERTGPCTAALIEELTPSASMQRSTQLAWVTAKEALSDAGLMMSVPDGKVTGSASITKRYPEEKLEQPLNNSDPHQISPADYLSNSKKVNRNNITQDFGQVLAKEHKIGLYLGETLSSVEAWIKLENLLQAEENEKETTNHASISEIIVFLKRETKDAGGKRRTDVLESMNEVVKTSEATSIKQKYFPEALFHVLERLCKNTKDLIVKDFRIEGEAITFASGCTGGLLALGRAARDVQLKPGSILLAGGTDSNLFPLAYGILSQAKLLTTCPDPCRAGRPFDQDRDGELTGEGSALFVIEHASSAAKRNVKPYAVLSGFGAAGEGYHFKYNKLDGLALIKACQEALDQAELNPFDIDLVIAHASGFQRSDAIEVKALSTLFGSCKTFPPVVSIKGATGQPFSAGDPLQVAAALCALQTGVIPPTVHFNRGDEEDIFDHVPEARQAEKPIQHVLVTSYGYGGGKAALILSAWSDNK